MTKKSDRCDIISNCWVEDGITSHYAVQLSSVPTDSSFDLFSSQQTLYGQFSAYRQINESTYEAIRDPLGIGKLFYTETSTGDLFFSRQFTKLLSHKTDIYSVPPGMVVRIGSGGTRELIKNFRASEKINDNLDADSLQSSNISSGGTLFQKKLTDRLNTVFSLIRNLEDDGWQIFIALSGGLDSSTIAKFSVDHLAHPIACTLDLGESEDAEKSSLIAKQLGIRHLVFATNKDEILTTLDDAPRLCQDFRDFNVHCTVLNLLLAKNIRAWADSNCQQHSSKIIVLTGDLMNEYTCDYAEEVIDGTAYYRLPRVGKKDLQRHLIRGLDTSDRELLPFGHYGLNCIQPYAILYDLYLSLKESLLETEDAKSRLNSFLVPREITKFIPKTKLRAQVGSRDNMGVLGLCHNLSLNDKHFRQKLLEKFDGDEAQIPIFMGKYDVETFS